MDSDKKYYVYIVECVDKTLYTGFTDDLDKRIKAHNEGNGAKYTAIRTPVKLVYHEEFEDKKEALSREWFIKHRMKRPEKLILIEKGKDALPQVNVSKKVRNSFQTKWQ